MTLLHGVFYNNAGGKAGISPSHPHIEILRSDGTVYRRDPPTISGSDFYFSITHTGDYKIHAWSDTAPGYSTLNKTDPQFPVDVLTTIPAKSFYADVPGPYLAPDDTCHILIHLILPPGKSLEDVGVALADGGPVAFERLPDGDHNYVIIQSLQKTSSYELIVSCGILNSGKIIKATGDGYSREMDLSFQ